MGFRSGNKKKKGAINKLPEEIVLSILSLLPMNQLARSSLVSRQWRHYWRHLHVLNFDNPMAFKKLIRHGDVQDYPKLVDKGRRDFMNWVDSVINNHLGCSVDEFNLVFYFNDIPQHVIDGWVMWAFSKKVERLRIDFNPHRVYYGVIDPDKYQYVLDLPMLKSCDTKFHLTSLFLRSVHVTTDAMECFLRNCGPTLDYLCIVKSPVLTRIGAASLPSLKYCKIYDCPKIEGVDIRAPKLVCFKYYSGWHPVMRLLRIEDASALSSVSIGVQDEDCFVYVLHCLYKYFPQLEYLKLSWLKTTAVSPIFGNFPVLGNLKHLKLFACLSKQQTLDAWVPFIGACPLLHKLTMLIRGRMMPLWAKNLNHDRSPLLHLKTIEIRNFNGANVDLDIANFVLQNAAALQEVIVYPSRGKTLMPLRLEAPFDDLHLTLPSHVKLVVV